MGDKEGFLKVDGTYVLEPSNYRIENYFDIGFGEVYKDPNQYNLIDKEGNWLFDKPAFLIYVPRYARFVSQLPYDGDLFVYDTPKTFYLYSLKEHRFKPAMFKDFEGIGDAIYLLTKPNDKFIVYDIVGGKQIMIGYGIKKGYNGFHWFEMNDGKLYASDIDGNIVDINSGKIVWENPYE